MLFLLSFLLVIYFILYWRVIELVRKTILNFKSGYPLLKVMIDYLEDLIESFLFDEVSLLVRV